MCTGKLAIVLHLAVTSGMIISAGAISYTYYSREQRLGTYKVLRWFEDRFEQCKGISADTPVEYHTLDDLQFGRETSNLLPKFIRRSPRTEEMRAIVNEVLDQYIPAGERAYLLAQSTHMEGENALIWTSVNTPAEGAYAVSGSFGNRGGPS